MLQYPPGYDFERSTFRFRLFGDDLASRWVDGGLHRVLRSGLPVRLAATGVTAHGDVTDADRAEVAHLLGFGFDLDAFTAAYPELAARAPGFRPPLLADPFEMLVTSVTAQQVSLLAACAIRNRFVQRFGRRVEHAGGEWWGFPEASQVTGADLGGLGLSGSKMRAIAALATADLALSPLDDAEVRERLLALPGIGPWTADYLRMRAVGEPDVLLSTDLAIRGAAKSLGLNLAGDRPDWAPWRSYASHHLWATLSTPAKRDS